MIKAIETVYNGYRFRSRLEARWAVFFDAMGFKWEYEKEGYDLDGLWYLPDFWLPRVRMWAEVKAEEFNDEELAKAKALVTITKRPLLMLIGIPARQIYFSLETGWDDDDDEVYKVDTVLSNHHNYYEDENRFYVMPGSEDDFLYTSEDMIIGINAARQARFFEHGENGISV
jgi:hypothetical protein